MQPLTNVFHFGSERIKTPRFRLFVFFMFFQKLRRDHFAEVPCNQFLSDPCRVFTDPHHFQIRLRCTIHFSQNHSAIVKSRAWGKNAPSEFLR
jgi:hypothetical protein